MIVEGPNGLRVEFPDGTDDATVDRVMREATAAPKSDNERFMDMLKSGELKPVNSGSPLAGIGQQFQKGLVQGAGGIISAPAMIGEYLGDKTIQGIDYMMGREHQQIDVPRSPIDPLRAGNAISDSTGIGDAKTTPESFANTIGSFLPGMFMGGAAPSMTPAAMVPNATAAVTAALGSEGAGQATKGTSYEPYARLAGALAGGAAPNAIKRAVTPFPLSPQRQKVIDTLKSEGVDLTAGQTTGNATLKNIESELGGGKGAAIMEQQGEQFTAAALRRVGVNANRASPEVINDAFVTLGNQFDDLARRNSLAPDPSIATSASQIASEYARLTGDATRAPIVKDIALDLVKAAQSGLDGDAYQTITSKIGTMSRKTTDPALKDALGSLKDTLDDAMERQLQAAGSPDAGVLSDVRNKYRNLMVIEQAAKGAGIDAADGLISPSQLRNATIAKHGGRNYVRGQGDFAELARAGESAMKPLPNSGTASRTAARNIGASLPAIAGTVLGGSTGNPLLSIAGGVGGAALPFALGRAVLSGPGRKYLTNQTFARGRNLSAAEKVIISLLGYGNTTKPKD